MSLQSMELLSMLEDVLLTSDDRIEVVCDMNDGRPLIAQVYVDNMMNRNEKLINKIAAFIENSLDESLELDYNDDFVLDTTAVRSMNFEYDCENHTLFLNLVYEDFYKMTWQDMLSSYDPAPSYDLSQFVDDSIMAYFCNMCTNI